MQIKEITNNINNMKVDELRNYCFEIKNDFNLLILNLLLMRFIKNNKYDIAILISELLIAKYCFLDGIESFEIYFYQMVLERYPKSEPFLQGILSFCLPPYNENMKEYFDYQSYKKELERLYPSNPVLKMI